MTKMCTGFSISIPAEICAPISKFNRTILLYVKMKLNFSTMFHPKYWTLGGKMLFKKGVRRKKAKESMK